MPGTNQDYAAVAAATTLTREQQRAIFAGLSQQEVTLSDEFTKNDYACKVRMWCDSKGISVANLKEIMSQKPKKGKKSKKDTELLRDAKKDLKFLFKKELQVAPQSEVIAMACTDATKRACKVLQELKNEQYLPRCVQGLRSQSVLERNAAEEAIQSLKNSSVEDLTADEVWRQFMLMHDFRPTQVQLQILEFFTSLVEGTDEFPSRLIEGVCGSGKTFGLAIVMRYVRESFRNKSPVLVYSHPSLAVVNGFEANCVSVGLPMAFVNVERKLVSGKLEEVLTIKLCHETLAHGNFSYILKEGVVTRRINSPTASIMSTVLGDDEKDQEVINPLMDLYIMITSVNHGLTNVRNRRQMPCVLSVRQYSLLPTVMGWHQHIGAVRQFCLGVADKLREDINVAKTEVVDIIAGDRRSDLKEKRDRVVRLGENITNVNHCISQIENYHRLFTHPVAIADDWGCHKDSPEHMEMLVSKVPTLLMTATPSRKALNLISNERLKRGMTPVFKCPPSSDTVGQGIALTLVEKDDVIEPNARASTTFIENPGVFAESCFPATTLSMEQVCGCLKELLGPLEFRNMLIQSVTSNQGLNEIRRVFLQNIRQGLDIESLNTPVKVEGGKKLEFYNSIEEIRSHLPDVGNCESDLKVLCQAFIHHKDHIAKAKKSVESIKATGGEAAKEAAMDLCSLNGVTFNHELIGRHVLSSGDLMDIIATAIDEGVASQEIMAFARYSVLAVHRDSSPKWYIPAMKDANRILSDDTLATGITLPNLTSVSIHDMAGLSAEQVIQMSGRAGRPGQGCGVVSVTSDQELNVMSAELGSKWCQSFRETFPCYGVSDKALALFDAKIRKCLEARRELLAAFPIPELIRQTVEWPSDEEYPEPPKLVRQHAGDGTAVVWTSDEEDDEEDLEPPMLVRQLVCAEVTLSNGQFPDPLDFIAAEEPRIAAEEPRIAAEEHHPTAEELQKMKASRKRKLRQKENKKKGRKAKLQQKQQENLE